MIGFGFCCCCSFISLIMKNCQDDSEHVLNRMLLNTAGWLVAYKSTVAQGPLKVHLFIHFQYLGNVKNYLKYFVA